MWSFVTTSEHTNLETNLKNTYATKKGKGVRFIYRRSIVNEYLVTENPKFINNMESFAIIMTRTVRVLEESFFTTINRCWGGRIDRHIFF